MTRYLFKVSNQEKMNICEYYSKLLELTLKRKPMNNI